MELNKLPDNLEAQMPQEIQMIRRFIFEKRENENETNRKINIQD